MSRIKALAIPIVMSTALTSLGLAAQEDNPFEYKPRQEVAPVETVVQVDNSELSDAQREQVISLLTKFFSEAGVNQNDSLFTVGDGKRYLVIPDEDRLVGKVKDKFIVWDDSRNINIYYDKSSVDDVVTATEYALIAESNGEDIKSIGEKISDSMNNVVGKVSDFTPPPPPRPSGQIKIGRQSK